MSERVISDIDREKFGEHDRKQRGRGGRDCNFKETGQVSFREVMLEQRLGQITEAGTWICRKNILG